MFHLNRTTRERINFEQLDSPPLREYTVDVVDYYKLALSSNDPYIKFISFYHVMEYFYDEVFKKKNSKLDLSKSVDLFLWSCDGSCIFGNARALAAV